MDPSPANWRNLNSQTSESIPVPFPAFKSSLLRGRVSTKRNPKVAALTAGATVGISDAFAKLKKEGKEAASQSLARGTTFDSVISKLKQHPSDIPSKQPQAVLDRLICNKISEVLINWQDTSPAEASWEKVDFIQQQYPAFTFEDKRHFEGSNVTNSSAHTKTYRRFTHGKFKLSKEV